MTTWTAVIACVCCAFACLSVSYWSWHRDPEDDEPRNITKAVVAGIPGILFAVAAIQLILK